MRLILFHIQTLWNPGEATLASALEMLLREIGLQLKLPSVGTKVVISFLHLHIFFLSPVA